MSLYPQIRILLSTLIGVLLASLVASADQKCASVLPMDPTSNLIGYLGSMVEQGFVKAEGLQNLNDSIAGGELVNPISSKQSGESMVLQIHREGLAQLLGETLDAEVLERWLLETIKKVELAKSSRDTVSDKTQSLSTRLRFVKVPKGQLWVGDEELVQRARELELSGLTESEIQKELGSNQWARQVRLLQDYEVSSTAITQQNWLDIMGDLPEHLYVAEEGNLIASDGRTYSPDHPVTDITFWAMLVFANKLSESKGVKPAYNLDETSFWGNAAKGKLYDWLRYSSDPRKPDSIVTNLLSRDDYYATSGFRLPTRYEMEYLGRYGQGKYTEYHFGVDRTQGFSKLESYAWLGDQVMQVGLKKPLIISGHGVIYDYHGNTREALFEWEDRFSGNGNNPQSSLESFVTDGNIRLFGGAGKFDGQNIRASSFDHINHEYELERTGFRLVRSLP